MKYFRPIKILGGDMAEQIQNILYITRLGGVLTRGAAGGAEVFSSNLLQAAASDKSWLFDVLTSDGRNSPYREIGSVHKVHDSWLTRFTEQQFLNTKIIYTTGLLGHLIGLLLFVYGIIVFYGKGIGLVAKNKYQIIYANGGPFSFIVAYLLYRRSSIPYIIHLHGAFRFDTYPAPIRTFYLQCLQHARDIIVTSADMRERITTLVGPKVRCAFVRNFVPPKIFKPLEQALCRRQLQIPLSALVVHSHNRLGTDKNIDILLKVIDLCRDVDILFSIIGDGYYASTINKLSTTNPKVLYRGAIKNHDLPIYINSADISWCACDQDNISLVAIESLYCGIPLISCDISVANDKSEHIRVHPTTLPPQIGYLVPENPEQISMLLHDLQVDRSIPRQKRDQCIAFAKDNYGSHNVGQIYDIIEAH